MAAFQARESAVRMYGRTWWLRREEPQMSFLDARPALRARLLSELASEASLVSSAAVYATGADGWDPVRRAEHERVLTILAPSPSPRTGVAGAVYVLLGLPGSGKTSALRPAVRAHAGLPPLMSDADDVRVVLPEYAGGLGSAVLQEETAVVVYGEAGYPPGGGLQDRVLSGGGVALLDVVGDPRYLPAAVRAVRSAGRRVYLLLTQCPVEACVERVMRRAVTDGRFVPPAFVRSKMGVPRAALEAALSAVPVDGWAVVDTSGPEPVPVEGDGSFVAAMFAR